MQYSVGENPTAGYADVAQTAEQRTCNAQCEGATPSVGSNCLP